MIVAVVTVIEPHNAFVREAFVHKNRLVVWDVMDAFVREAFVHCN